MSNQILLILFLVYRLLHLKGWLDQKRHKTSSSLTFMTSPSSSPSSSTFVSNLWEIVIRKLGRGSNSPPLLTLSFESWDLGFFLSAPIISFQLSRCGTSPVLEPELSSSFECWAQACQNYTWACYKNKNNRASLKLFKIIRIVKPQACFLLRAKNFVLGLHALFHLWAIIICEGWKRNK